MDVNAFTLTKTHSRLIAGKKGHVLAFDSLVSFFLLLLFFLLFFLLVKNQVFLCLDIFRRVTGRYFR